MSLEPRQDVPSSIEQVRGASRRQARTLSGSAWAVAGGAAALLVVAAFVVLDYGLGQMGHRLVKILLGVLAIGVIAALPQWGLLLMPIATPFLEWLPRLPVPGINALNLMLGSVFGAFAVGMALRRQGFFRFTQTGWLLAAFLIVAALSIVRGVAWPTGLGYQAGHQALQLFRAATTFAGYFIALWMVRGRDQRRGLVWALALSVLAEGIATVVLGRDVRGRATGSIGQANELGTFLAMGTVFAIAVLPTVRSWIGRSILAATIGAGVYGVLLSVSRGALIALAAGTAAVAVRTSRWMVLILVVAVASSPLWIPDYVRERLLSTQIETEFDDAMEFESSAQLRVDTWQAVMTVIEDHWLVGVGFGGLGYVLPHAGQELGVKVKDSAHNTYLRVLGEMGVLGLLLLLALFGRCVWLSIEGARVGRDRLDRQVAVGFGAAALALALSCWFGDRFFGIVLAGNFWISCALVEDAILERRAEMTRATTSSSSAAPRVDAAAASP